MISLIVAMDQQRGIGKNNKLLFRIHEDMKRFRELTSGHPVIMGRKTFESIGHVLPNRTNIIVTRDTKYKIPNTDNVVMTHSLEEALVIARSAATGQSSKIATPTTDIGARDGIDDEVFIIGGGQIYAQALPLADKLYLTIVEGEYNADTFFPDYSAFKKVIKREKRKSDRYKYTFLELIR